MRRKTKEIKSAELIIQILNDYAEELKRNLFRAIQQLDDPEFERDRDNNFEYIREKRKELRLLWHGIKQLKTLMNGK